MEMLFVSGYRKCHPVCSTRRPLHSPPGRDWNTDDKDGTWMTGEYTSVQSREIISLVTQKNQRSILAA